MLYPQFSAVLAKLSKQKTYTDVFDGSIAILETEEIF